MTSPTPTREDKPNALSQPPQEVWPVVIIGTGFSGLGMAIKLREAGIGPFVLLERAAEIGGTWRDNNYPGCACDVPSPLYSFSFAPNPNWTRLYAGHDEIQAYLVDVVKTYGLRPHIRFNQEVACSRYDDKTRLWTVTTTSGESYRARVVISGMGALSDPALPNIDSMEDFQGERFHSAQWNHDFDVAGKRVAVIGTGASAIQFVPHLARTAQRLHLFQRTPPWIVPRPDRPISPSERALYKRVPLAQKALRGWIWSNLELRALAFTGKPVLMKLAERFARKHIGSQVTDPQLLEQVTPKFTIGCKRVLLSDDYYPALMRDNVTVVTDPIARASTTGLETRDGKHYEFDAIIYGTGFAVQRQIPRGAIFGRGGADLAELWDEHMQAYKGTCVTGFPNLFFLAGPNTGLGHSSMVYMIESQIAYIIDALRQMKDGGWDSVEVQASAQARFNKTIAARQANTVWATGCRSWYLDDRGRNTTLWPGFTFQFRKTTARFDAEHYAIETTRDPATSADGAAEQSATALVQ